MEVFVSYARADQARAEWAADTLRAAGHTVELDVCWRVGENWVLHMNAALGRCDRVVALCSSAYYASRGGSAEWAAAFTRADADGRPVLIPVPIDDTPPEPLLASVIRGRPLHRLRPEEAAAELLRAVDPEHHPPSPSSTRLPDHLQHVLDLAEEKPCRDRDEELRELERFRRGEEPSAVWEGAPYTGKTTLFAAFVARHCPPDEVAVAAVFLTRTAGTPLADQLIRQLAAIAGRTRGEWAEWSLRRAVREALSVCGDRPLLLVVDGLDADPESGGRLAEAARPGVRILASTRPGHDVGPCPPLRRRTLTASRYAPEDRKLAREELRDVIRDADRDARAVLALVAAARGGLTQADLARLTGRTEPEVVAELTTRLHRTLARRTQPLALAAGPGKHETLCQFRHDTLTDEADALLEEEHLLADARRALTADAAAWADRGWPATTPDYPLRRHLEVLCRDGAPADVIAYVTDARRHARLWERTGGDEVVRGELRRAREWVAAHVPDDLVALTRVALAEGDLRRRGASIHPLLPAVWVLAGRPHRGRALAEGIDSPQRRAQALTGILACLPAAADEEPALRELQDLARAAVAEIKDDAERGDAEHRLDEVLAPAAVAPVVREGLDLARDLAGRGEHAAAGAALRAWLAAQPEEPRRLRVNRCWEDLLDAALADGDVDAALAHMRHVPSSDRRWGMKAKVVVAACAAGPMDPVVADWADVFARAVTPPSGGHEDLARVLVALGRGDRMWSISRKWPAEDRLEAAEIALRGQPQAEWTRRLDELKTALLEIDDLTPRVQRAVALIRLMPDPVRSREGPVLAAHILGRAPDGRSNDHRVAAATLAGALAAHGLFADAVELCHGVLPDPDVDGDGVLSAAADTAMRLGAPDAAYRLVMVIGNRTRRADRLAELAVAVAGPPERAAVGPDALAVAATAAHQAEVLLRETAHPQGGAEPLAYVVVPTLLAAGEPDRAFRVAAGITHPYHQAMSLLRVANHHLAESERDAADPVVAAIDHPYYRATGRLRLVEQTLAVGGDPGAELAVIRRDAAEIDDAPFRDKVLRECAQVLRNDGSTAATDVPDRTDPPPEPVPDIAAGDAAGLRQHLSAAEALLAADDADDPDRTELHRIREVLVGLLDEGTAGTAKIPAVVARIDRTFTPAWALVDRLPHDALRRAAHEGLAKAAVAHPAYPGAEPPDTPERCATATDHVYATWARHYLRQRRIGAARDMIGATHGRRLRGALFTDLAAAARARRDPQTLADYREAVSLVDLTALRALAHIDRAAFLEVVDTELAP